MFCNIITVFRKISPPAPKCQLVNIGFFKLEVKTNMLIYVNLWRTAGWAHLIFAAALQNFSSLSVMIQSFRTDRSGQCRPRSNCCSSLIRVYTVCHLVCIFWNHYSIVTLAPVACSFLFLFLFIFSLLTLLRRITLTTLFLSELPFFSLKEFCLV